MTESDDTRSDDARSGSSPVRSVQRSIALLACFSEGNGREAYALSDLARRTELSVSTARRLLQALCSGDMLRQDPDTERYSVGPMLMRLGRQTYLRFGEEEAQQVLIDLARRTGESVIAGVQRDGAVLVALSVRSQASLAVFHPVGARLPLHASALGKVLLAHGEVPAREQPWAPGRLAALTPRTLVSSRALKNDLEVTRSRGYSIADEEQQLGERALGAPLRDRGGVVRAAISVQGPASRMSDERIEGIAAELLTAARVMESLPGFALLVEHSIL